jgi:hypothetical protein
MQVMSVKALGIALKLTFSGMNKLIYPQTWAFFSDFHGMCHFPNELLEQGIQIYSL